MEAPLERLLGLALLLSQPLVGGLVTDLPCSGVSWLSEGAGLGEVDSGPCGSHLLYVGCGLLTPWWQKHQLGGLQPLGFPVLDSLEMGI